MLRRAAMQQEGIYLETNGRGDAHAMCDGAVVHMLLMTPTNRHGCRCRSQQMPQVWRLGALRLCLPNYMRDFAAAPLHAAAGSCKEEQLHTPDHAWSCCGSISSREDRSIQRRP